MYKVSIIIPVYNVAPYVTESIKSALNQDFRSIEYVIVNDCSTDNSIELINAEIEKNDRFKDITIINREKNGGLSTARNTGLENAHGEYVFFMDSDDEISSDCISLLYSRAKETSTDFVVSNFNLIGAKSVHIHTIISNTESLPPIESYFKRLWSVSACNKLYRLSFLNENNIRFVEGIQHEDYLWSFQIAKYAKSLSVNNKATYDYKIRSNSITTIAYKDKKIESMLYVLDNIYPDNVTNNRNGHHFVNFVKMNTALYILNYQGNRQKSYYYNQLRRFVTSCDCWNLYNLLLSLPYPLFYTLIKPLYTIYKWYVSR